jgi:hypothetical protein
MAPSLESAPRVIVAEVGGDEHRRLSLAAKAGELAQGKILDDRYDKRQPPRDIFCATDYDLFYAMVAMSEEVGYMAVEWDENGFSLDGCHIASLPA